MFLLFRGKGKKLSSTVKSSSTTLAAKKNPPKKNAKEMMKNANELALQFEKQSDGSLAPKGYTKREVKAAKNYDVVSFARAMNDDFGGKVKDLFQNEREAADEAIRTGLYIGWRCPEFKHDCQRIGKLSKCFCGHVLKDHEQFKAMSRTDRFKCYNCNCKAFEWIPSRFEDVGEFWFARRRNFDPSTWRAKCKCKHTHEEHKPNTFNCKMCGCSRFDSSFLCAACDRHWEDHRTYFEVEGERKAKDLPYGENYIPFNEIPTLKKMVVTGVDDEDMNWVKIQTETEYAALRHQENQKSLPGRKYGNNQPFAPSGSNFKPVYD